MEIPYKEFEDYYTTLNRKVRIGRGAYGEVYKVKNIKSQEEVAVKILEIKELKLKYINEIENTEEIEKLYSYDVLKEVSFMKIMEDVNNENIVKLYDFFKDDECIYIVMELCDENLETFIETKKKLNEKEIFEILSQLNNSFKIMVKNKIVHRDLKLENILLKYKNKNKNDYILKLTDYGVSKKMINESKLKTCIGTPHFMAPEVLDIENGEKEKNIYNDKCDLWSLGIIIYKLFFGKFPFLFTEEKSYTTILNKIKNFIKITLKNINTGNNNLDDLIKKLLIIDPNERIGWEEYFNHPFFQTNKIAIYIEVTSNDKKGNEFNNIYFLDNDSNMKKMDLYKENEEIKRLIKSNNECELYINGKKSKFNKYFKPNNEGIYKIEIYFKNKMKVCSFMFSGCKNITSIDLSFFDLSNAISMHYMFGLCTRLKEINLKNINIENINDLSYIFNKCIELKKIVFPESFNTINVINMQFMFHCCQSLLEIYFSSSFKTDKVVNMRFMFSKCNNIKMLDLSHFNTINVNNMNTMFNECNSLEKIKLNQKKFTTENTTDMAHMFNKCYNLKNLDLSSFNTEKVKYLNHMFCECKELRSLNLSNFKINKEANLNNMFDNCLNLKYLDLSSFIIGDNNETEEMFNNLKNIKLTVNKNSMKYFKKNNKEI